MPVFISYSHNDREFVNKLCENLVLHKVNIWIDRWEMKPGDSMIASVQAALQKSGAIVVVLSPSYVDSSWCKKELNAGLIKELEDSGNVVIPVLLADCEIPLFLREKFYADFRKGFDESFKLLLEALSKHANPTQDRIDTPEFHIDWSGEAGTAPDGSIQLRYNFLEHAENRPFSVFSVLYARLNGPASKRYKELTEKGFEWFARSCFSALILDGLSKNDLRIVLSDSKPVLRSFGIRDPKQNMEIEISIETRWLGEDTGKDIVFNLSDQILMLTEQMVDKNRKLTDEERTKLGHLVFGCS